MAIAIASKVAKRIIAFNESEIHRLLCQSEQIFANNLSANERMFMKRFSKCLLVGLIGNLCIGQIESWAELEVSASVQVRAVSDFHAPLTPYGTWVEVGSYGRCWRPTRIVAGWQPYSHGNWVWTDCGWYWASDEPWSWACYHYGSWTYDPLYGWVWVPGIEWAPAWVYWRVGGGYCGWAPRGPRGVVVAPRTFVFVETARFHEPVKPSTVIVNNAKIINQTTEIGSIKYENRNLGGARVQKVAINEGPGTDVIQKATGRAVSATPIREVVARTPGPRGNPANDGETGKNAKPPAAERNDSPEKPPFDKKGALQSPGQDKDISRSNPPQQSPTPNAPSAKPGKPRDGQKEKNSGKSKD